jgi:flagellar biosynthesis/type III secretory pathway M-ring protein FliF/YscJ
MFEDLNWKAAFRRAAFAAALYLLFVYVMSTAFPDTFGASGNLASALIVALIFFFVYAPLFAFAERRKKRRLAEMKAQTKGKKPGSAARTAAGSDAGEEDAEAESLKGRHNPNTSRKKTARRRRR